MARIGATRRVGRSRWRRDRLLIVCFHGFSLDDEHRWRPGLFIRPERFADRMEALRREGYTVLALSEAIARVRAGTLPYGAICLTVDDGLWDFREVACPVLRSFGYPVTLYASTYYVTHRWPVFGPMASYLLWKSPARTLSLADELGGEHRYALNSASSRELVCGRIVQAATSRGMTGADKQAILETMAVRLDVDLRELNARRFLTLMSPAELRALDPALVSVQLHTHRHRIPADRGLFRREILENRQALALAGRPPEDLVHFCYPFGRWSRAFLPWLRELGIVSAVTCEPGLVGRTCDSLLLPRFVDSDQVSDTEFLAWCAGVRAVLRRHGPPVGELAPAGYRSPQIPR